ncbi:MAG TPA: manganese efflux pump MntP family protein [Candidatus Hydrogenedentes bacterium]|nr:manganese efflux pump MntP family protein [Candidatus Hydrogenedentota bacterium]HPU98067.1 manganese efflux pump MntP family protein [Candidatus Hydrogenedentota bacterium]
MQLLEITGLAVGLAMDATAVGAVVGAGIKKLSGHHLFRLSFHFGLFQAMMPVLGWLAGAGAEEWLAPYDHWVAFMLLGAIGGKGLTGAWKEWRAGGSSGEKDSRWQTDPTRGWSLVALSLATSLDAFAVGVTFGIIGVNVFFPAIIIGAITGAMTFSSMLFGRWLGRRFGLATQVAGGVILILIGLKILLEHLMAG